MKSVSLFTIPGALVLSAFLIIPANVHAQSTAGQATGGQVIPRSENYLLGPGDVLSLTVAGFPEFGQEIITIPPDGVVSLARLGPIRMTGRTRAQVQSEIRQKLIARVRLRNPQVALSITGVRSGIIGNVSIGGDVPRGGPFPLREGERLSDLLAEVGLSERLEERRATLSRGNQRFTLDLNTASSRPGSSADILLRAGDSIAVRSITAGRITIQGDVERPGSYELHTRPSNDGFELGLAPRLSDLIFKAGGLKTLDATLGGGSEVAPAIGASLPGGTAPTGNTTPGGNPFAVGGGNRSPLAVTSPLPSSGQSGPRIPTTYTATLQRNGAQISLNVDAATNNVAGRENIFLKAGDLVSISLVRPMTVLVDGAITKTGPIQLAPGAGVLELLAIAGPLTRTPGDLRATIRRGEQTIPLDLPSVLLSSESSANVRLQNGDIVQLREPETMSVLVAGQVTNPGPVRVRPGGTIYEAIQRAGGPVGSLPLQGAQLSVLRLEKDGTQRIYPANASGILKLTDVRTNLVLRDGDIVNLVGGEDQTVFVSGEVVNPNSFQITPGEGLVEVITRAGGPKDSAALTRVRVTRKGTVQTIDAYDAVKNAKPLNFTLLAGDTVSVPVNTNRVAANQSFAKPGYYTIPERGGLTFQELITEAQLLPGVKRVYIVQPDANGTVNPKKVVPRKEINMEEVRRGRVPDFALSPRDVVYAVPPKTSGGILQALAPLGFLQFLF